MTRGVLDEAYVRFHRTGPEFDGRLSNHGPMATDALIRLGHGGQVTAWSDAYQRRLLPLPPAHRPIDPAAWSAALGDDRRIGDWLVFFDREVRQAPWRDVVTRWWPRLLPGAVAAATHPLIRTGHAVRALTEQETAPRLAELGQALGYWAARWQALGGYQPPAGSAAVGTALDGLPRIDPDTVGGIGARLAVLTQLPGWSAGLAAHGAPASPEDVPAALDALTDAAVSRYGRWATGNPVMLVHSATAPRAARLVLGALPTELWAGTYAMAWAVSAAVTAAYRPTVPVPVPAGMRPAATAAELGAAAADHGDEHVIKFVEVAIESHARGNPQALVAGTRAVTLIATPG